MRKQKMTPPETHNYFEDFRKVYTELNGKEDSLSSDAENTIEHLADFYNLTPLQVILLSVILIKGTSNESLGEVMQHIKQIDEIGDAYYGLLVRRIVSISTSNSNERRLCVMDGIRSIFKNGEPLGVFRAENLVEELNWMSLPELFGYDSLMRLESQFTYKMANSLEEMSVPSAAEEDAFAFWTLCHQMVHHFTTPFVIRRDRDATYLQNSDCSIDMLKKGLMNLEKSGIAITVPFGNSMGDSKSASIGFILSPKVAGIMFHGEDGIIKYDDITRLATIIRHTDIEPRKLFFSAESQQEVDHLRKILSLKGYNRACRILKSQHRNPSIQSLFFGPPGTGKTEVIRQIARESKRDLIFFDAAKVTYSPWGATEKAYRDLFLSYRYLVEISGRTPILVMNEADQLLSSRISSIEGNMDKSENIVTDILLEELENMTGILLATTNLLGCIDKAFERRFLFMTELSEPDAEARTQIWRSLLKKIPETDARELADEYKMSGAQISNVVAKRELAELYYEGDRGLDFIKGLCEQELSSGGRHRHGHVRLGF